MAEIKVGYEEICTKGPWCVVKIMPDLTPVNITMKPAEPEKSIDRHKYRGTAGKSSRRNKYNS